MILKKEKFELLEFLYLNGLFFDLEVVFLSRDVDDGLGSLYFFY